MILLYSSSYVLFFNEGIITKDDGSLLKIRSIENKLAKLRTDLQANRAFIIAETTAYIANQYPSLTYSVADCERDTGYLIDSLVQDVTSKTS